MTTPVELLPAFCALLAPRTDAQVIAARLAMLRSRRRAALLLELTAAERTHWYASWQGVCM